MREVAMVTERQVQETVARCVSSLDSYVNRGKTWQARGVLDAEAQGIARLVTRWGLGRQAAGELLLRPLEAELVARHGPSVGLGLSREFTEAFNGLAGSGPVFAPVPSIRASDPTAGRQYEK
jgi:hypothetical protein